MFSHRDLEDERRAVGRDRDHEEVGDQVAGCHGGRTEAARPGEPGEGPQEAPHAEAEAGEHHGHPDEVHEREGDVPRPGHRLVVGAEQHEHALRGDPQAVHHLVQ